MYRVQFLRQLEVDVRATSPRRMRAEQEDQSLTSCSRAFGLDTKEPLSRHT
jgi:hypothetical protein